MVSVKTFVFTIFAIGAALLAVTIWSNRERLQDESNSTPVLQQDPLVLAASERRAEIDGLQEELEQETFVSTWDEDASRFTDWREQIPSDADVLIPFTLVFAKMGDETLSLFSTESTPSGDWMDMAQYYFWPTGHVAATVHSHVNLSSNTILTEERYYNAAGEQIWETEQLKNIRTGESIPNDPEMYPDPNKIIFATHQEILEYYEFPNRNRTSDEQ